ncbi:hypothetical protein [Devosia riboflavina]|uniref:hypothetical protein n=1 Tax=Devosia riboflavina TaxID=46914 RepID=UPI000A80A5F4|nr:hypothetical protein [Devosia riboflavina]
MSETDKPTTKRVFIRDSYTPTVEEKGSLTPKVEPVRTTSQGDSPPPAPDKD